ncbi:HEAT repeat domain-containing protein [Candidatus Micrarchaeota archaeon]|nr:HEAT repeat domain-containing protein [Candidatus Micrarchaeota archaeon]
MAGKLLKFEIPVRDSEFPRKRPLKPKNCILSLVKSISNFSDCGRVLEHIKTHPEDAKDVAMMIFGEDPLLSTKAIMLFSIALMEKSDFRAAIPVLEEHLTDGSPSHAATLLLEIYGNANEWEKVDWLLKLQHPCVRDGVFMRDLTKENAAFRESLFSYYESCHRIQVPKDIEEIRTLLMQFSIKKASEKIAADPSGVDHLTTLLADPNPVIKSAAAATFMVIGPGHVNRYAHDFLVKSLDDEHFNVADAAAATLALCYVHSSDAEKLEALLTHDNPMARYGAARALSAHLGKRSSFIIPILATLPADNHPEVRKYMASQLFDATKELCSSFEN